MLRRMIVPAGLAAVLGLLASAALADGEKRTTVQDENRVESFDRTIEPPRRAAVRAPPQPIGGWRSTRIHHAHGRHAHRASHSWGGHHGLHPRRHLFIAGVSGHRLPGIVNVATVTYRTHVYDTPAYPSAFLRLPAVRSPLRPDAGPDLQQALLLLSRSASFGDVSHGSRTE